MAFNIVLHEPEIPNNTGNIGRLCLATGCRLHLIKPYGFEISDKRLKRAGLDYWQHIDLHEYETFDEFLEFQNPEDIIFYSAKGKRPYTKAEYKDNSYLIFGKESVGLPNWIKKEYEDSLYQIPLFSPHIRSLNIANSVAIVIYEGLRKLDHL